MTLMMLKALSVAMFNFGVRLEGRVETALSFRNFMQTVTTFGGLKRLI